VIKDARQVRLYSRGGMDWTKRLASLAEALKGIPCRSGVIAAASSSCPPATARLISLAWPRRYDHANPSLQCNAFDLLHRDGATFAPCHWPNAADGSNGYWSGRMCHACAWSNASTMV
jgi:ATP-dependent DNA ligase